MSGTSLGLAIGALVCALAALAIALYVLVKYRRTAPAPQGNQMGSHRTHTPGPPALVVNSVKVPNLAAFRHQCNRIADQCHLPRPLWYTTTVEEQGEEQARQAVAAGASVVVAVGGDGTVRQVARALVGTQTPMALVPMGTGNLLARNLQMTFGSTQERITAAFTGRDRTIDVGWMRAAPLTDSEVEEVRKSRIFADLVENFGEVPQADPAVEYIFLVMGGLGFDAAMVGGADNNLKARIGWMAYTFAALRHSMGRRIQARMWIGDEKSPEELRARTILFANCGRLPGGVALLPDAELDDGWLDIAAIDTTGGPLGWMSVGGKILLRGMGIRRPTVSVDPGRIVFRRGRTARVQSRWPVAVQADGDIIGISRRVEVRVSRNKLIVRS